MDTDLLRDLAPHYVVMVVLAYATITVANNVVGSLNFWVELAVIIVVFFGYRVAIVRTGYGPEIWE
ncbi:hypothetical protein HLRTI_001597 [Halorhabdus tiamatea SARL4B]|uniref:Uncharacterized protein n=1 Tax=Halorhabdus tiamatea SARL4B TaxID=1033806 RepID=F7PLZ9_9EURY|nr:hypothetical protein [Halorhabdus tiamatea]ERJ06392.1 hypothetical protein HLRTI_001597 [Halorhabdus tiamatea SARL4B]CCQ34560.1 hypothetical protein HTIA_2452 [Halorhabdus tiamatea SARL4B]